MAHAKVDQKYNLPLLFDEIFPWNHWLMSFKLNSGTTSETVYALMWPNYLNLLRKVCPYPSPFRKKIKPLKSNGKGYIVLTSNEPACKYNLLVHS